MTCFSEIIDDNVKSLALVGHVHPDGDCVGSVMATANYLKDNYSYIAVTVYLEPRTDNLLFMTEAWPVREDTGEGEVYDLVISLDSSDLYRIGAGAAAFKEALEAGRRTVCIDHHMTNPAFAAVNHIEPEAAATCEVLTGLFEMEKIGKETAACLFTGLVHDSGVFSYDATSAETLISAAALINKGIPFSDIIQKSYTDQPYLEMKITGEIFSEGTLYREEHFFVGFCPKEKTAKYGLNSRNLGGVVAELAKIKECDAVLFLYQYEDGTWKGSLRSKCELNVAEIAGKFGGGGHRRAAGFTVPSDPEGTAAGVLAIIREMRASWTA